MLLYRCALKITSTMVMFLLYFIIQTVYDTVSYKNHTKDKGPNLQILKNILP